MFVWQFLLAIKYTISDNLVIAKLGFGVPYTFDGIHFFMVVF